MATHAMSVSAPGTRKPPVTGWTVTSPCGSSRRTRSTLTDDGSGTPTVTSTSIRPPRSRTSWNRGRLECRIASDTARQAAFVPSPPWTSTPIPNSSTHGFALTLHLRTLVCSEGGFAPRMLGCRAGHYSAGVSEPTGGGGYGASDLGRPVVRDQLRTYTDLMLRSPRGVCSVLSIVRTFLSGESVQTDSRDIVLSPLSPFMVRVSVTTSRSPSNAARVTTLPRSPG